MRRYFFERPARKEPGKTGRSREKPERNGEKGRAGNSARAAMSEMPDNAARAGRRHGSTVARWRTASSGWQVSGGLQVAGSRQTARQSGGGQQKIGGGRQAARWKTTGGRQEAGGTACQRRMARRQSAGQAAASRLKEDFMYIQTATIGRWSSGTATAPGRGNQGTIRNRLRPVPAKNMQANRYYPQRYRESTGKGISGGR